MAKVRYTAYGCWEFTGRLDRCGYGQFTVARSTSTAHRWAYVLLVGRVPEGKELDHLCRNRCCINPDHLEPVTHRTNSRRGQIGLVAAALQSSKTHCVNGHAFDEENTYRCREGWRRCRICNAASARRAQLRKKERE